MDSLFSGLESMGLGKMKDMDLYGDEKKTEQKTEAAVQKPVTVDEASLLLDKTFTCPVCDQEFKEKIVKTGKAKLLSQDIDLRPRYADIDAHKYDVVACPICGYAALARNFNVLTSAQGKLIKENISANFTGLGPEKATYSYDDVLARLKLTLINTVVKRGKTSEKAYICLLMGWMTRGKAETLPADTPNRAQLLEQLKKEELDFLGKAAEGLMDAFAKESFPLCGMLDEASSTYLVSALCAEVGRSEEALRWVSRLITSKNANERIKERARDLKDKITNGEI